MPRWLWAVGAGIAILGVIGTLSDDKSGTVETAGSHHEGATTTEGAITTEVSGKAATTSIPTTSPPTTVATTTSLRDLSNYDTEPAAVAFTDEQINDIALFTYLGTEVNPQFSAMYANDPAKTVDLMEPVGDALCQTAENSSDNKTYTAAVVVLWFSLDASTQALFGGDAEAFGRATGAILAWRCLDEAERLFG